MRLYNVSSLAATFLTSIDVVLTVTKMFQLADAAQLKFPLVKNAVTDLVYSADRSLRQCRYCDKNL